MMRTDGLLVEPEDASEEWRPIAGHPGYFVSDHGRVRSEIPSNRWGRDRILRGSYKGPYRTVFLTQPDGPKRTRCVHNLVAEAFLGPRADGHEVRHFDGNSKNNAASNLRYGTATENADDMRRHGTHHNTRKTHCPKGHPYDETNTRRSLSRPGARECWTCSRANWRAADHRRRARAATS